MQKYIKIFIILFCFTVSKVQASIFMGADITYKCLGNNVYHFTLTVYGDCSSEATVQSSYYIYYKALSCGEQGAFLVNQTSAQDISITCPTAVSDCQKGGTIPGTMRYTYEADFTIPKQCPDWEFYWQQCYRNDAITTISNPSGQCIFVEATLNNSDASCINSPVFNIPDIYQSLNQKTTLSTLAQQGGADSLTFSFITPRTNDPANPITVDSVQYLNGFGPTNFITSSSGIGLNSSTGQITITPSQVGQVAIYALLVTMYKNGKAVGSTIRDIEVRVSDYSDRLPVITGINKTSSYTTSVCAGQLVQFNVLGSDPDTGQTVNMTFTNSTAFSNAVFYTSPVDTIQGGQFQWQTTQSDIGTHSVIIQAKDDACPTPGVQSFTYTINVLSTPIVNIGQDTLINNCRNLPITINSSITGGTPPYTYLWSTKQTTSSIKAYNLGYYMLKVTDANQCSDSTERHIEGGLKAKFYHDSLCVNSAGQFFDSSVSFNGGKVISWKWNFGDGGTSTAQDTTHTYEKIGTYVVSLKVTDNNGCTDSVAKFVTVADIPSAGFVTRDSCQNNPFYVIDNSKFIYSLDYLTFTDTYSGTVLTQYVSPPYDTLSPHHPVDSAQAGTFSLIYSPSNAGINSITYTIINVNGCSSSVTKKVHINPQPQVAIIQPDTNLYLNCNKPDTTVIAQASWITGNKLLYTWSNGKTGDFYKNGITSDSILATGAGTYGITVVDSFGCTNTASISIVFPIIPRFTISPYCNRSDTIVFTDSTVSHWPIVNRTWNFGDGTPPLVYTGAQAANDQVVKHFYAYKGWTTDFVTLSLKDSTGCTTDSIKIFYQQLPSKRFLPIDTAICFGDTVMLEGPTGTDIDSWTWTLTQTPPLGNVVDSVLIDSIINIYNQDTLVSPYKNARLDTTATKLYSYTTPGWHNIYMNMIYNNHGCDTSFATKIYVRPQVTAHANTKGGCANDTSYFSLTKLTGDTALKTATWNIQWFQTQANLVPWRTLTGLSPASQLDSNGKYQVSYTGTDYNGCSFSGMDTTEVQLVGSPAFKPVGNCLNEQILFFWSGTDDKYENREGVYWDFGDGDTSIYLYPEHQFKAVNINPGYKVTHTVYSLYCSTDTSIYVKIYPIPKAEFVADSVCEGMATGFNASTSVPADSSSSIVAWKWYFTTLDSKGDSVKTDSTISNTPLASYKYPSYGNDSATLIVTNSGTGCTDTISYSVFVKPNPKAAFGPNYSTLQAYKSIEFYDSSQTGTTGLGESLVKWKYYFGDGTVDSVTDPPATNGDIFHTYNGVTTDTATEIVYNNYGCSDTTIRIIDLHAYLVVPNAFSPNSGNVNDKFHLFYKGITDLKEYKIFNRYGEVVFDGENNLQAFWDGTFRGDEQPIGVYVYYIVGTTVYGNDIYLKGNLTLLR